MTTPQLVALLVATCAAVACGGKIGAANNNPGVTGTGAGGTSNIGQGGSSSFAAAGLAVSRITGGVPAVASTGGMSSGYLAKGTGGVTTASVAGVTGIGGYTSVVGKTSSGGAPAASNATGAGGTITLGINTGTGGNGYITGGLPTPSGWYTNGSYTGPVWTGRDTDGSTITRDAASMCASGNVIATPFIDGGYDYGGAWGAMLGWGLNQPMLADGGAGDPNGANLSNMTSITVGVSGAEGLNLMLVLSATDADSGIWETEYCAPLPATGGTINLASLYVDCWAGNNIAFNKTTTLPSLIAIQVVGSIAKPNPFNFCVTALTIQ